MIDRPKLKLYMPLQLEQHVFGFKGFQLSLLLVYFLYSSYFLTYNTEKSSASWISLLTLRQKNIFKNSKGKSHHWMRNSDMVKQQLERCSIPPKSKTRKDLRFIINQENNAAPSTLVYHISETTKLNNLCPYYYFKYTLTELSNFCNK